MLASIKGDDASISAEALQVCRPPRPCIAPTESRDSAGRTFRVWISFSRVVVMSACHNATFVRHCQNIMQTHAASVSYNIWQLHLVQAQVSNPVIVRPNGNVQVSDQAPVYAADEPRSALICSTWP